MVAVTCLLGAVMVALVVRNRSLFAVGIAVILTAAWQFPLSGEPMKLPKVDVQPQERVAFESKAWNIAKTPEAFWPPNLATVARVHDLFGYDSILDGQFVNRLKEAIGAEPAPPENGNMMLYRSKDPDGLLKQRSGLNALGSNRVTMWQNVSEEVASISASPSAYRVPRSEKAKIVEDGYDHQTIELDTKITETVIKDRYIDGMTSDTPGCDILNADGFRFVQCKEGTTRVVLRYPGPKAIYLGLAALAMLASLVVVFRKMK
jgi:hypothetical protein